MGAVLVVGLAIATPAQASTPASAAAVNCSDFSTQAAAQNDFLARGGPASDPEGLDGDANGIACETLPCPCNYSTTPTTPPPPPPDSDGDGVADLDDLCPTDPAPGTDDGCPAPPPPPRTYAGSFGFADFAQPRAFKPPRLHPFSADNGAWLYGLRWQRWGKARAYGRGKAAAKECIPSCAEGRLLRSKGGRVTLWRLRAGDCNGREARFYTRALLRFPRGLGLRPFTVKLKAACVS